MSGPRYAEYQLAELHVDGIVCLDCGAAIGDKDAHTRFHSILSGHAWALAVLKTSHIAAHVHDKYDAAERIDSKRFDSWSAGALAEVAGMLAPEQEDEAQG